MKEIPVLWHETVDGTRAQCAVEGSRAVHREAIVLRYGGEPSQLYGKRPTRALRAAARHGHQSWRSAGAHHAARVVRLSLLWCRCPRACRPAAGRRYQTAAVRPTCGSLPLFVEQTPVLRMPL